MPKFRWRYIIVSAGFLLASMEGAGAAAREMRITVTPAATGRQLVRTSLPLPDGFLRAGEGLMAIHGAEHVPAAVRVLTWRPGPAADRSARRAMVTFPYTFKSAQPVPFRLQPGSPLPAKPLSTTVTVDGESVKIAFRGGSDRAAESVLTARLLAPPRTSGAAPVVETVEQNAYFLWQRFRLNDSQWPRVIEVRVDCLGNVALIAHLQRNLEGDAYAPEFGWQVETTSPAASVLVQGHEMPVGPTAQVHHFARPLTANGPASYELRFDSGHYRLYQPAAPFKLSGKAEAQETPGGKLTYRYLRSTPDEADASGAKVPMQQASWRRAELVIGPTVAAALLPTLEYPQTVQVDPHLWDDLYQTGMPLDLRSEPELAALLKYNRDAIVRAMAVGNDWGNVTSYNDHSTTGSIFGMNRLNHCLAIFADGFRSGDHRLREEGVLWCDNFYDLSIWWGPGQTGGTRYNNIVAQRRKPLDNSFMWRSNSSVNFCTKGFSAFYIAYEETGDPRMLEALNAQFDYVSQYLHADTGECRNIGGVLDFIELYRYTGEQRYLDQALRLFRELRTKLMPDNLFSQGGAPIVANPPFIDNDEAGYKYPFAKPYIIGYALEGLPRLARDAPDEPRLRDVISAVADFLAQSQDPLGGWRYPHPRSSYLDLDQAIEHAWQISEADRLIGAREKHLDAIERVLRQRLLGWERTGSIFTGVSGWELTTGKVKSGDELAKLYAHPDDRDASRDYTEGAPHFGGSSPEGLVYLPAVLAFYLEHRPASRLLAAPAPGSPLAQVLARVPSRPSPAAPATGKTAYQTPGVTDYLPAFRDHVAERMTFPLSWLSGRYHDFAAWRRAARKQVMACLLGAPPAVPFDPKVVDEQDRGSYVAQKVVLNITGDSRVLGFLLVPKGKGPFPAVLLLHDHGARFDIGKEKVIKPWDEPAEKLASADEWVNRCYGGRYIGDELARRGFVCFCTDALNWSDRGGGGYEGQQALASNLLHLGMSFAGVIAYEDLRAADFLASLPEVDGRRIAAMGLSMGCFRTWQVAALSDHIAAGVAICWMATVKGLMVAGNNETKGQSAYCMTHPGLSNFLDYPDVASLACPKPMLFYNGLQDALFPVPAVEEAYAKMRRIWASQHASDRLETKLWDVPHEFSREMQDAAFAWLDRMLKPTGAVRRKAAPR